MSDMEVPESDKHLIMHVSLPIGDESILMGGDVVGCIENPMIFCNNFTICTSTKSKDEADTLFNGLSKGGKVMMPMELRFGAIILAC